MTGLVIATHADLAQGLLNAAFMIVGPQERAAALCTRREDDLDAIELRLKELVAEVGSDGDGVLVMTDMFGGTPTNVGLSLLDPGRIEILTGVSLPMVLKFFGYRSGRSLADLTVLLKEYARQGVVLVSETVSE